MSRSSTDVWAEIRALGRPVHPLAGGGPRHLVERLETRGSLVASLQRWQAELAEWRLADPTREARHEALLAELDALEATDGAAKRLEAARRGWAKSALPGRVVQALESPRDPPPQAMGAVARWWAGGKPWCLLLGATGVGKSVASGWVLRQAWEQGQRVAWVTSSRLAVDAGGFSGAALADRLRAVDVLVVDDVGRNDASEWARSTLQGLLLDRHEAGDCRTVLSSNLDKDALKAHFGDRLYDRVRNACQLTECLGKSLRGGAQ